MRSIFFIACCLALSCAKNSALADQIDWPNVSFTPLVTNVFSLPTSIAHAGDGTQRLFIEEQKGRIRIIQNSNVLTQPFLDISSRVLSAGTEQGLLGLAFPPGYSTNAHFYVDYTRQPDGATVISRFSVTANPNVADPNSEQVVLVILQTNNFHNGGQIAFGPDGYLYIGKGDGGPEGDPQNNAQNTKTLLGKLLRIDAENGVPYRVPTNNPFVGNTNYAPQIWALGLRNPWRFSFDRLTGDLYIGDVGQNRFEEIDFQPAGSGGQNYGWNIVEGFTNYSVPVGFTNFSALTFPVYTYDHASIFPFADGGGAVMGGYVYRGPTRPRLDGTYIYGDFAAGIVWALRRAGTNWQNFQLSPPSTRYTVSTFGEDDNGEMYLAAYYQGIIYKIQDNGKVWVPVFQTENGIAYSNSVIITCATPNAVIHYTTNSIDPTESDPIVPSDGSIPLSNGAINKARAFRADLAPSDIATAVLGLRVGTPTFSRPSGPITNNSPVSISTVTPGATIYYTTNGLNPTTNSFLYTGTLALSGGITLKAIGAASGFSNSLIASVNLLSAQVANLSINPSYGTFTGAVTVTMSCPTPGAKIYYTLDDSPPATNSLLYTAPFTTTGGVAITAFGTAIGYVDTVPIRVFLGLADYKYPTVVTTFAGSGQPGASNGFGPSARFWSPEGICFDQSGNLYVTDTSNNLIRKISPDRLVTTFAGTGVAGYQNGPRLNAQFSRPIGICADPAGNIYVADANNYRIRKIDTTGNVTTFAGSGTSAYQDGTSTNASFVNVRFIEFDHQTNLCIADWARVRRITPDGNVSTIGGDGANNTHGFSGDLGLCVDPSDNVYAVVEWGRIFQFTAGGVQSLFAGDTSGEGGYNDGARLKALFASYYDGIGIGRDAAADALGNIYVSDYITVRKIDVSGWVSTFAGAFGGLVNGVGRAAAFYNPTGLCVDTDGNVFAADSGNNCIRKISPDTANIGIADDWQLAHFGQIGIDPNGDPDHDGQSNFAEFWAGTDPLDANSRFAITSVTLQTSNAANIIWQSVPGKSYAVKFSTNLVNWVTLTNSILATDSSVSYMDTTVAVPNSQRFYRVSVNF